MFLQGTRHSTDRTARAHTGNKNSHFTIRVRPDFFPRSMFMSLGIGGILKLLQNNRTRYRIPQFFRFGNGAGHTCQSVGQYNLRTQGFQQITAFHTHGLRHGQYQMISLDGCYHRQSHAGIATGRFNNRGSGVQSPTCLGILNHGKCHTVLHASRRIKRFQLSHNISFQSVFTTVFSQFHQRSMPNQLRQVLCNFRHNLTV